MNPPPNNAAPLCGTHTDAEFEQVKAELDETKRKLFTEELNRNELSCLGASLAASQAQVEMLRTALHNCRTWAILSTPECFRDMWDKALSATATAAQAGKERAT